MKQFLCVLALVCVMAGPAFAGGGSKANATIKVTNNATVQGVATIIRPAGTGAAYLTALGGLPNLAAQQAQLEKDGGKVLSAGGVATFAVKAGANDVVVVWINGNAVVNAQSKTYSVGKGKVLQVSVTDNGISP